MSEKDLLYSVIAMAELLGVLTAHFRPAQAQSGNWMTAVQGNGKGYPDLTLVGPGGIMFRELKSDAGRLSPEQRVWLDRLRAAGADADVWRPCDLASGRINREIRSLRIRKVQETA